jgi:hypothetical protein
LLVLYKKHQGIFTFSTMSQNRAAENADLIAHLYEQVLTQAKPWLAAADNDVLADPASRPTDGSQSRPAIVHSQTAEELSKVLDLGIDSEGLDDMPELLSKVRYPSLRLTSAISTF